MTAMSSADQDADREPVVAPGWFVTITAVSVDRVATEVCYGTPALADAYGLLMAPVPDGLEVPETTPLRPGNVQAGLGALASRLTDPPWVAALLDAYVTSCGQDRDRTTARQVRVGAQLAACYRLPTRDARLVALHLLQTGFAGTAAELTAAVTMATTDGPDETVQQ